MSYKSLYNNNGIKRIKYGDEEGAKIVKWRRKYYETINITNF